MTTPVPSFTKHRYYSGPLHGWITFFRDEVTGTCWWLDNNQWRYWDSTYQDWVFASVRSHTSHVNTVVATVIGLVALLAGAAVGGPGLPLAFMFALLCVALGAGTDHVQNHHPRAYQALSVASAAYGAYGVYGLAHKANETLHE